MRGKNKVLMNFFTIESTNVALPKTKQFKGIKFENFVFYFIFSMQIFTFATPTHEKAEMYRLKFLNIELTLNSFIKFISGVFDLKIVTDLRFLSQI